jgi:uncharacterized membrane-anchored protein YitT (DUF2179 family)
MKIKRADIIQSIKNTILVLLGITSAAFGLKSFLIPNGFIDGGVTGISLLIAQLTTIPLSLLIIIINIPFIIAGYAQVSKNFAITTSLAISALALIVWIFQFPIITNDKLLTAVFGGFFLGAGIGLCMRGGGVIDGTEILSILVSKKTSFTIGDIILIINIIIFSVAAFLLNIETALYSILTYLSASKTVDFVIQGIEEYTGVLIISSQSDKIRLSIIHDLGRGVTILNGKGGYGRHGQHNKEIEVLYCVITRLEIPKLKNIINNIDDNAFVVMHSINDTTGGMIKKRPLQM